MYKNRAQYKAKQAGVDLNEVKGTLQPNKTGAGAATRPEDVIVSGTPAPSRLCWLGCCL